MLLIGWFPSWCYRINERATILSQVKSWSLSMLTIETFEISCFYYERLIVLLR